MLGVTLSLKKICSIIYNTHQTSLKSDNVKGVFTCRDLKPLRIFFLFPYTFQIKLIATIIDIILFYKP